MVVMDFDPALVDAHHYRSYRNNMIAKVHMGTLY